MRLVIDFDGTITKDIKYIPYKYGAVKSNIRKRLCKLKKDGVYIIVWTSRSWAEREKISEYLLINFIPHNEIICCKPIADIYYDVKNVMIL